MIVTPVSANTANHIFAYPRRPITSTSTLTRIAKVIFSFAVRSTFLAILTDFGIASTDELRNTRSAASIENQNHCP